MIEAMEWKPCPFCGKAPREWGLARGPYEKYRDQVGKSIMDIGCKDCGMYMTFCEDKAVPYEEALRKLNEKWNRRAE